MSPKFVYTLVGKALVQGHHGLASSIALGFAASSGQGEFADAVPALGAVSHGRHLGSSVDQDRTSSWAPRDGAHRMRHRSAACGARCSIRVARRQHLSFPNRFPRLVAGFHRRVRPRPGRLEALQPTSRRSDLALLADWVAGKHAFPWKVEHPQLCPRFSC